MLEDALQEEKIVVVERRRCIKCKGRQATREDQLCDNCRYLATIEGILKSRKSSS
jgi:hypothetical protein